MKVLNEKYDIHPRNYHKPTPVGLKKFADRLLVIVLALNAVMLAIPDFPGKEWFIWGWNVFVIVFKLTTNTVTTNGV